MITRMRALSAVLHPRDRDALLSALQRAGVVHVTEKAERDTSAFFKRMETARELDRILKGLDAGTADDVPLKSDKTAEDVIAEYRSLIERRDSLEQTLARLGKDEASLLPFGDFKPDHVRALRERGVSVRFFRTPARRFRGLSFPETMIVPASETPAYVYFAAVLREGEPPPFEADEERLPEVSLHAVRADLALSRKNLSAVHASIRALSAYRKVLARHRDNFSDMHGLMNALENLSQGAGGRLLCMEGFFPGERETEVRQCLDAHPVWYETADPAPGTDVPIQLKNGWFARKFEPVLSMLSLPAYTEIDPVPFFAPFLVLFIGLCIGDVAYGSVILLAALGGLFKGPAKFRPVFEAVAVVALVVIAAGLAMNSFFGVSLLKGGASFLSPLSPYEGPKGTVYPMMSFAIVLGIIQVYLAIFLRGINAWRQNGFIAALFPVSFFPLFFGFLVFATHVNLFGLGWESFAVGRWKVGALWMAAPQSAGIALLCMGGFLFFLFNNPSTSIFLRPLRGLWEGFNFITGMLSSILSYLRLFALGLASGLLAGAFNNMAFMVISRDGSPDYANPMIVLSALILVLGHTVNFGLSLIGAIIHPLRLTFVEFLFNNLGFTGGGKPYTPLRKTEHSIEGGY